jgi:lipoprotein-anchoring transpeptidase ErfK/SrfK
VVGQTARRGRLLAITALCAAGLLATACQSSPGAASAAKARELADAWLKVSPAPGSKDVNPATGITVTAAKGTIKNVTVTGDPVTGTLSKAGTTWRSDWSLPVHATLTVTATAVDSSGHTLRKSSTFRTLNPRKSFSTKLFEGYRQTFGVGMPIILTFSRPVTNRAAVERSLVLSTSKPVIGAWYWDSGTSLAFRPRQYWPTDTKVSFIAHLDGLEVAPGVYGHHTLTQQFTIGESLILVASTATHHMKLYRDGKLLRYWPISTGRPGDDTPDGTYLTMGKGNPVVMTGPGYSLAVPWSVEFTDTGDFLHDAYWSVGEQGFVNVSHGCVNMPPAAAEFYYKMAVPGDPVTIVGSPQPGSWDNGWTYWFLSWPQLLKGSALHEAVVAGPSGSTFVDPEIASLVAATGTAPFAQPWPDNNRAR